MAKRQEIVVRMFLEKTDTGEVKPWGELTNKEIEHFRKSAAERVGKALSLHYAQHPEEFVKICQSL